VHGLYTPFPASQVEGQRQQPSTDMPFVLFRNLEGLLLSFFPPLLFLQARLAANVPKTIDNTRVFGSSYLTSDPTASSSKPKPTPNPTSSSTKHKSPFPPEEGEEPDSASEDEEEDEKSQEDDEDEEGQEEESATGPTELDPEGGIHAIPSNRGLGRDPKILLTTSAKATRDTYTFAEELRGIFPGGEFFKRPTGR
jgi:ribosome production factor 1